MPIATAELIDHLGLQRHPEGGWYAETWRSEQRVTVERNAAPTTRAAATSIYYLLERDDFSAFHRIASDELWLWQGGGGIDVHVLAPDAEPYTLLLGAPGTPGRVAQAVVPAGAWFAAAPADGAAYALCACVVAPGFEFAEFELAEREALLEAWPGCSELVEAFTR